MHDNSLQKLPDVLNSCCFTIICDTHLIEFQTLLEPAEELQDQVPPQEQGVQLQELQDQESQDHLQHHHHRQ